tara:strand:+ start:642 stop:1316 length:675 start_codon:yes stop_codon:yes gene_type:complete
MKHLNHILKVLFVLMGTCAYSQTIVLNACHPLIENQDYTFNQKTVDLTGRIIFETNPVDENSPCGGVGNCEFQIAWNQTENRWEIYVDDGNGTFLNSYVLYYNTAASTPYPPDSTLGIWVEETTITQSLCGAINSLSGDVQGTILGINDFNIKDNITLFPNPASDFIQIVELTETESYKIYNAIGAIVHSGQASNSVKIDIQNLTNGIYFLKFDNGYTYKFIKK